MEACWAHNPEVRGSKPRSAKNFYSFSHFFSLDLVLLFVFVCLFRFSVVFPPTNVENNNNTEKHPANLKYKYKQEKSKQTKVNVIFRS